MGQIKSSAFSNTIPHPSSGAGFFCTPPPPHTITPETLPPPIPKRSNYVPPLSSGGIRPLKHSRSRLVPRPSPKPSRNVHPIGGEKSVFPSTHASDTYQTHHRNLPETYTPKEGKNPFFQAPTPLIRTKPITETFPKRTPQRRGKIRFFKHSRPRLVPRPSPKPSRNVHPIGGEKSV